MSLNILDHIPLVASVPLQHMAVPQLVLNWQRLTCVWSNERRQNFWLLKVRILAYTNVYSKCMVKLLWMWILFDSVYGGLKKLELEEQHVMANRGVVALALQ